MNATPYRTPGALLLAVGILLGTVSPGLSNLLTNPGFETGDLSGWSTFGTGWRISTFGDDVNSGTNGLVNDILSDSAGFKGVNQEVAVTGGAAYDASVALRTVSLENDEVEAWLEIQWFDSSSGLISQDETLPHISSDQPYTQASLSAITAPVNAVTASVRGIIHVTVDQTDSDFVTWDDFSFQQIPEPSTGALVGLAALMGAAGLRRRTGARQP